MGAQSALVKAAEAYYDEFWVYGVEDVYDPTKACVQRATARACTYTELTLAPAPDRQRRPVHNKPISSSRGRPGGRTGCREGSLVLTPHEARPRSGPSMPLLSTARSLSGECAMQMATARPSASHIGDGVIPGFDSRIEALVCKAEGVVCMGGYNTFCQVGSASISAR